MNNSDFYNPVAFAEASRLYVEDYELTIIQAGHAGFVFPVGANTTKY